MAFPRRSTNNNAIGSPITDATVGSVLFVDTGAVLGQDNAGLNWDNANNLLTVKTAAAGKAAVNVGTPFDGSGYVEICSTNDMQVLSEALLVAAVDNGGSATSSFTAEQVTAKSTHTSTILGLLRALFVQATEGGGGGTVTNARGIEIGTMISAAVTTQVALLIDDITGATNNYAIQTGAGQVRLGDVLKLTPVAFASLPASPAEGMIVPVNNADTAVWGATISGTGSNHVLAYYDGTNWTVMGK